MFLTLPVSPPCLGVKEKAAIHQAIAFGSTAFLTTNHNSLHYSTFPWFLAEPDFGRPPSVSEHMHFQAWHGRGGGGNFLGTKEQNEGGVCAKGGKYC